MTLYDVIVFVTWVSTIIFISFKVIVLIYEVIKSKE